MFQDTLLPTHNGKPLTKTQLKKLRRRGVDIGTEKITAAQMLHAQGLKLRSIKPKTINQSRIFRAYAQQAQLMLMGLAGTGKTFLSMYLGLSEVLETEKYEKVVVVRSVVPTRDIGFLPGDQDEKTAVYEAPYMAICQELFGRSDAYDQLKRRGNIEFLPTSFIRGTTIMNAVIIVDECQNLSLHELDTIMTRLGENCRIIFSGDFRQSDLIKASDRDGIKKFMKIIDHMNAFEHIELKEDDIVRSAIVKEYIVTKANLEIA